MVERFRSIIGREINTSAESRQPFDDRPVADAQCPGKNWISLSAGVAMAQTNASGYSDAAPSVLTDPATMKPFFSGEAMATLKSDEEVKAAFNALPAKQQQQMKNECQAATDAKYKDFCAKIGTLPRFSRFFAPRQRSLIAIRLHCHDQGADYDDRRDRSGHAR